MSFKMLRPASLFVLLATLAACSDGTHRVTPLVAENDPVSLRIAEAAEKASKALSNISNVEQYRSPLPPMEDFSNAPPALAQPITLTWNGSVEQVVQTLASKAGYNYRVAGIAPPLPLAVSLNVYERPVIEVLRDIGLQLGSRADVAVDVKGSTIQLRYAPTDGKI
ncbi:MAG: DotD/TraH family lipoprotein [Alphaproteobacteria bacterium]